MTEETCMQVWQREMRDGIPLKTGVRKFVHEHKLILIGWLFVLPTSPFMAQHYGQTFIYVFLSVFLVVSLLRIDEVRRQKGEFNNMMTTVMEIRKGEVG